MTALENIEQGRELTYLVVLKPSIRLKDWAEAFDVGPTTYVHDLSANFVTFVGYYFASFSAHSSLAGFSVSTEGRYFFDVNAKKIYADFFNRDTDDDKVIFADYEVHVASKEINYFRDPLDDASTQTFYFPGLSPSFSISKSIDNSVTGFMPSVSSSVNIVNVDFALSSLLVRSTLSKKEVDAYVISGQRLPANTASIFKGTITQVSFDDNQISLSAVDKTFDFDGTYNYRNEFFNPGLNLVSTLADKLGETFSKVDASKQEAHRRVVYGLVNCLETANIDFVPESGASTDNDIFYAITQFKNTGTDTEKRNSSLIAYTVVSATSSTVTLNTVDGLHVGDELLKSNLDYLGAIVSINTGTKVVTHNSGTTASGTIYRDRIARFTPVSPKTGFTGLLQRAQTGIVNQFDYSVGLGSSHLFIDIDANNSFTNPGFGVDAAAEVKIMARVYGEVTTLDDPDDIYNTTNMKIPLQWHHVIYEYLRREVGLSPDEIDLDSFLAIDAIGTQHKVGVVIPKDVNGQLPTHKEVLTPILATAFASLYQNAEGKIAVTTVQKITSADFELTKDDIISIKYSEEYLDTSYNLEVQYRHGDLTGGPRLEAGPNPQTQSYSLQPGFNTTSSSGVGTAGAFPLIYSGEGTRYIETRHFDRLEAEEFAGKAYDVYSVPFSYFTVEVSIFFLSKNIGDTVKIKRNLLPGAFSTLTLNEVLGRIVGIDFSGESLTFKIWTQIGVQDSPEAWN